MRVGFMALIGIYRHLRKQYQSLLVHADTNES
jgi:hypothetical protein